ncbi:MAG: pentapeptide repeat-containing protein [Cyanobacteria bacterium J06642_2]
MVRSDMCHTSVGFNAIAPGKLCQRYGTGERTFAGANLSKSDLSQAQLVGIDLHEANLRGANLHGTNFTRANLAGAKLSAAKLGQSGPRRLDILGNILFGAIFLSSMLVGAFHPGVLLASAFVWGLLFGASVAVTRAHVRVTDFSRADLRGANLNGTRGRAIYLGAIYDNTTEFAPGFDPAKMGMKATT